MSRYVALAALLGAVAIIAVAERPWSVSTVNPVADPLRLESPFDPVREIGRVQRLVRNVLPDASLTSFHAYVSPNGGLDLDRGRANWTFVSPSSKTFPPYAGRERRAAQCQTIEVNARRHFLYVDPEPAWSDCTAPISTHCEAREIWARATVRGASRDGRARLARAGGLDHVLDATNWHFSIYDGNRWVSLAIPDDCH